MGCLVVKNLIFLKRSCGISRFYTYMEVSKISSLISNDKMSLHCQHVHICLITQVTIVVYMNFLTIKVSKGAKIRNRYNQVQQLTQDTNRKVTNSQLDTTNESQEVSPFPAGDHKAHIDRRTQRHSKRKTEKT